MQLTDAATGWWNQGRSIAESAAESLLHLPVEQSFIGCVTKATHCLGQN